MHPLEPRRLLSATLDHGWLTIRGTQGDDAIVVGDSSGDLIVSLKSRIFRFATTDVQLVIVYGGRGNDTIDCGHSSVSCFVRGEGGNDVIFGSAHDDTIIGGNGKDQIFGDDGDDLLVGNSGSDSLFGGGGQDTVFGVKGSDELHGDDGDDSLVGGRGNDIVFGDAGADRLSENNTNWVPDFGNCSNPNYYAGRNVGSLFFEPGPGLINLGRNDFKPIADGADTLWGGDGSDTVTYEQRQEALKISLDDQPNDGAPGEKDNVRSDIENIIGGASGDLIVGNDVGNVLEGGRQPLPKYGAPPVCRQYWTPDHGKDTIYGAGGNDTLNGQAGANLLFGGDGDDVLLADGNFTIDTLDGGAGDDTAQVDVPGPGGDTNDAHHLIEHVLEYPDLGDREPY